DAGVHRVAVTGGTGPELLDRVVNAHGIAVDTTYVYFSGDGEPGASSGSAIYKVPKQGGVATAPLRYAAACFDPALTPDAGTSVCASCAGGGYELAVDATTLYILRGANPYRIYKLPK